ncbi:MAG: group II intron reverse transcriptase/maturase [Candidatus Thorarchaeota archaeon]
MTGVARLTGATTNLGSYWKTINWDKVETEVKRLQMRIAKAEREGKHNKVKALQWMLSHSFSAKLLAVKRVTSRKGAKTPGVDGIIWNTPAKKMKGALSLKQRGYKALPLRRAFIPKKSGKKRPLGIPTLKDRAMQAIYLLTLEPIAETRADSNSYGFRYFRACRDAIAQCFCGLAKSYSPRWILDADIKACFDEIDHDWLLENIPLDKRLLKQWLKCGYFQNRKLFPTKSGTPQGGIISPTLANMTLDGLEKAIKESCPRRKKVNFIRYADDFIVTAESKELLENDIIPAIKDFLKPRGLMLSTEKTKIVRIEEGFDFLGQNLRKYRNKLLIKPSSDNYKSFVRKIRDTIKSCRGWKTADMIKKLNSVIRGWANYHKYIQAAEAFFLAGRVIFQALKRWIRRRHSEKNWKWMIKHYFNNLTRGWIFSCWSKDRSGNRKLLELLYPSSIKLVRYIKIRGAVNPFDPQYKDYFKMRRTCRNYYPINNNLTAGFA